MKMRCDLIGLLNNAADTLDGVSKSRHPYAAGEAYALREAAGNIEILFRDLSKLDEFAQLYCLTATDFDRADARAART